MGTLIFNTNARLLPPLLLIFSVFLLIRGHNVPGGGFVGGLVAATAFTLYGMAYGVTEAMQTMRINPRTLIALGLLVAVISGLPAIFLGDAFMTGLWYPQPLPVIGKVGTPLLFDVGVYLLVMGISLTIIFTLMEE
ncbi:MAG: Na+/H+ antiporter subunit B [Chloroflexales bacterium]|nr:Na+/H+ antiporter subunit B [Chloroflexales bacterium]